MTDEPIESDIRADRKKGVVVWTMSKDTAEFYICELQPRGDAGIAADIRGLDDAVRALTGEAS